MCDLNGQFRSAVGIVPLPSSGSGVVGLLSRDDDSITVLSVLGTGTDHVLVIDCGSGPFGLLVEEVIGVVTIDDTDLAPAPRGQEGELVSALLRRPDGVVLVVDAPAVAKLLTP